MNHKLKQKKTFRDTVSNKTWKKNKKIGKCYESMKDRRGGEREKNKFYSEVNIKHSREKECRSKRQTQEEITNTSREGIQ